MPPVSKMHYHDKLHQLYDELGVPAEKDRTSWNFKRYVPCLPAARELVLFNRSWYNRGGVERAMGFCIEAEQEDFMGSVSDWQLRRPRGWLDVPFAAH